VTTRRHSARAPRTAASTVATGEPLHDTTMDTGPQQEEAVAATSQVLVPHAPSQGRGQARPESRPTGDHEAVEHAADDDADRGHSVSINNALTEVLRIHEGPSVRLFEVSVFRWTRGSLPILFVFVCFLILPSSVFLTTGDRSWRANLGQGMTTLLG
jgi:hypothetical protein